MLNIDKERLRASERAVRDIETRARQHRRAGKRKLQDELEEDVDNLSYGAWMHWQFQRLFPVSCIFFRIKCTYFFSGSICQNLFKLIGYIHWGIVHTLTQGFSYFINFKEIRALYA